MNNKEKASKIGDIILNIVLGIVLVILGISIFTAVKFKENPEEAYLFGYRPLYILTGSMEPALKEKGICIVKRATYDEIEVDDIITYMVGEKTITHRVIEITEDGIRTKGDNNNVEDAYLLKPENIQAKVVFIFNGSAYIINDLQRGPIGYIKWICFPIFVVGVIVALVKGIKYILKMEDEESEENSSQLESSKEQVEDSIKETELTTDELEQNSDNGEQ